MKKKNRILTESQKRQITENKEKSILESFASTFNKIKRIDENAIDEIGPRMAAKALDHGANDPRKEKLQKDAITSMFSGFIGKDKPFFIQTRKDTDPVKFMLVEVLMYTNDKIVEFHFYNETGEDDDSRFAPNKKEITIKYSIKEDAFNDETYLFNRFTINFFVKSANLIREAYYTRFAPKAKATDKDGETEQEWVTTGDRGRFQDKYINDPDFEIKSKVNKNRFRMFNFDSKNLMNKGIDESELSEEERDYSKDGLFKHKKTWYNEQGEKVDAIIWLPKPTTLVGPYTDEDWQLTLKDGDMITPIK